MPKCPNCQEYYFENRSDCPHCHHVITDSEAQRIAEKAAYQDRQKKEAERREIKRKLVLIQIIIGIPAGLCLGVWVGGIIANRNPMALLNAGLSELTSRSNFMTKFLLFASQNGNTCLIICIILMAIDLFIEHKLKEQLKQLQ